MMSSDNLCNDKQHGKLPLVNLNKLKKNRRCNGVMVSALNYRSSFLGSQLHESRSEALKRPTPEQEEEDNTAF